MQIFSTLDGYPTPDQIAIVTIGFFDGVHLGHQKVIKRNVEVARTKMRTATLITFDNHPLAVLRPETTVQLISTALHKTHLLEQCGVDLLFNLPFTKTFSQQDPKTFLEHLQKKIPFSHLILGHDASIGKARQGSRETVSILAKEMGFEVEYLEALQIDDITISSSQIRKAIRDGRFLEAKKFLGRPYSILSTVTAGSGVGRELGYPTANLDVSHLCLPPYGIYTVEVKIDRSLSRGVASLGVAPTVREDQNPVLEVYLFEKHEDLYGKEIEVFFQKFLRPERKFSSLEALREQIQKDVAQAQQIK